MFFGLKKRADGFEKNPVRTEDCLKTLTFREQGNRKIQQDSLFCGINASGFLLAMVADGMGGLENGNVISNMIVADCEKRFSAFNGTDPVAFLYKCIIKCEKSVERYLKKNGTNGGSTFAGVLIGKNNLYYSSVGDSGIYLFSKDKAAKLNVDHNFGRILDRKADAGLISKDSALADTRRNQLTSFIGMGTEPEIDSNAKSLKLSKNDIIMVCSDGLTQTIDMNTIAEILAGNDFEVCGEILKAAVNGKNTGVQDNFSAILIKITGEC